MSAHPTPPRDLPVRPRLPALLRPMPTVSANVPAVALGRNILQHHPHRAALVVVGAPHPVRRVGADTVQDGVASSALSDIAVDLLAASGVSRRQPVETIRQPVLRTIVKHGDGGELRAIGHRGGVFLDHVAQDGASGLRPAVSADRGDRERDLVRHAAASRSGAASFSRMNCRTRSAVRSVQVAPFIHRRLTKVASLMARNPSVVCAIPVRERNASISARN
jgi:hypothetical protein